MGETKDIIPFKIEKFKKSISYLDKYFGIGYGYFNNEIQSLGFSSELDNEIKIGESLTQKILEKHPSIKLSYTKDLEHYFSLFDVIKEDDENDDDIVTALWLLVYILEKQPQMDEMMYENQDYIDYCEYEIVRKDLLKLYIYMQESLNIGSNLKQPLTIRHDRGKIELDNYSTWFSSKLLKRYLDKYLPDITSVEQAREAQKESNPKAGRKASNPIINIVIYGIYRLFQENKNMKSDISNDLCELIISYLIFVDLIGEDHDLDHLWMRAQIKYMKKHDSHLKFAEIGENIKCSLEDLKSSGIERY